MLDKPMLNFIHISDTHIHADPEFTGSHVDFTSRAAVAELIKQINAVEFDVDFVLHTGDIMTDPEKPEDYLIAKSILSEIRFPVHYLVGNHDRSRAVQEYLVGEPASTITEFHDYELEVNGVQIICLDSNPNAGGVHFGLLTNDQLDWLAERLNPADSRPLVVAVHHHALPLGAPWLDGIVLKNGYKLHELLLPVRDRLRGVFYGHIHENTVTVRQGISYYSVVSGWFQTRTHYGQIEPGRDSLLREPGFNLVTLTEKDTFVRRYRFPLLIEQPIMMEQTIIAE
ncbi:MAG: metallophosphoesterase [Aggregatilineales bacterium]